MTINPNNSYDQIANAYLSQRHQFKNHTYLRKFVELLPKAASVLDIGCGAGVPIDEFLVKQGCLVFGFDHSPKQIELARKLVPKASFAVKNMTKLQLNEFSVDAVVCFYVTFHIPRSEHAELLKKIRSYLPPGGPLLITMGDVEWEGVKNFHGSEMHWSQFGAEKNQQLIKDAGFEILLAEMDRAGGEKHLIVLATKK